MAEDSGSHYVGGRADGNARVHNGNYINYCKLPYTREERC